MKVKELIEELEQLDGDLRVFTRIHYGGYDDLKIVGTPQEFVLDVNDYYLYGAHGLAHGEEKETTKGIIL